jgi:alkyl sulfatase BDS1-like metallo-beta-lactamase superfamily hydrolase
VDHYGGAMELRRGVEQLPASDPQSPDTLQAMPLDMFLDYLGIRLNGDRAAGKTVSFNLVLTDTKENYVLGVENSALHYSRDASSKSADATVTMKRADLNDIMMGKTNMQKLVMTARSRRRASACLRSTRSTCCRHASNPAMRRTSFSPCRTSTSC